MPLKFTHIEYYDCIDKHWARHTVNKVSCLAIVPRSSYRSSYATGINLCIALPHQNQDESTTLTKKMWQDLWDRKQDYFVVYLCNDRDRIRFPVRCSEGNGYDKGIGTSCIFAYFGDEDFDLP